MVERLTDKCEALSSKPSTTLPSKEGRKEGRKGKGKERLRNHRRVENTKEVLQLNLVVTLDWIPVLRAKECCKQNY
jgi:hypothetical protein